MSRKIKFTGDWNPNCSAPHWVKPGNRLNTIKNAENKIQNTVSSILTRAARICHRVHAQFKTETTIKTILSVTDILFIPSGGKIERIKLI